MKKYLVLILILLSFFTGSPLFAAEKTSGKNYDNNVKAIDENKYLKSAGVAPDVLGKFTNNGSMTSAEISKMQETLKSVAPNLAVDGKIGPETAAALALYGKNSSSTTTIPPVTTDTDGGVVNNTVTKSDANKVSITTPVPGIDVNDPTRCQCDDKINNCKDPVTQRWSCTVDSNGLIGFQKIMAEITRVFVYITLLFGVLAIVGLGIGYAIFSGGDEEKTKLIKNYAVNLMIGMMLLFFFRYILVFLAPWIFQ